MADLVSIETKGVWPRVVLVAAIIGAILFGWYSARLQLGNMLAGLTQTTDPNAPQAAEIALGWSPTDPAVNWLNATTADDLALFEKTVTLAPNDFRWRVEYARALEQAGHADRAEAEFRKAVELAPTYAYPRWNLGNFYLRQYRMDEAMTELKAAAANNRSYRDQVFSLAWDYFNKDAARVESLAGDTTGARVRLAYFFAGRGRGDDALRNWNRLTDEEKLANPEIAKAIAHGLFLQRRFPQSLEFSRQMGADADAKPETVTNASFEKGVGDEPDARFGWTVARNDPRVDIATDARVSRDGSRSVRLTFRNYNKPELYNLFQTVVVRPATRYSLRFWVRTENLRSAGMPLIDIANANADRPITRSKPFPSGTNDWQEMTVEFTTPENCTAISVRTAREACGIECPLTGVFWYDDFELRK